VRNPAPLKNLETELELVAVLEKIALVKDIKSVILFASFTHFSGSGGY
jgi:hypothetical protein